MRSQTPRIITLNPNLSDAEILVIRPIERMISIVESLAINPFSHSVARRNEKVFTDCSLRPAPA